MPGICKYCKKIAYYRLGKTAQWCCTSSRNTCNAIKDKKVIARTGMKLDYNRGKKWFNNGITQTIKLVCPEGWTPGKLK